MSRNNRRAFTHGRRLLLALVLPLALGLATPVWSFEGKVVGVSDGDTITVLNEKTPVKVRL